MWEVIILAGVVLGTLALLVSVLWRATAAAHAEERAKLEAEESERNAKLQQDYAEIATRGSDEQRAGGLLDDGKF